MSGATLREPMQASAYSMLGDMLDVNQLRAIVDQYHKEIAKMGYRPARYPDMNECLCSSILRAPRFESLCHVLWLCDEANRLARTGRTVSACMTLGVIQGMLFMNGIYTLSELQSHSRLHCLDISAAV